MKQILKFTSAAIVLASALLSCSNDEEKTTESFLVEADESIAIDKAGGEQSIKVTSTVDYVAVSSDSTWCRITEKTETGFKFRADANTQKAERTADITVTAVGFAAVRIRIVQAGADASFSIEFEERTKTFPPEGGEVPVSVTGNVTYTVTPSQPWCTYKDVTSSGFTLVAAAYEGFAPRTASVQVAPADGLQPVTITVTQTPNAILKNGWFVDELIGWDTSGTASLFKRVTDQYLPGGAPEGAYYITNNLAATAGFEGYITQKLTGIPNGSYKFSCDLAGYPGNSPDTDGVYLVALDKNGNEITPKVKCTLPSGSWTSAKDITNEITVSVTDGECAVGVYVVAAGGTTSTMTFKIINCTFQ